MYVFVGHRLLHQSLFSSVINTIIVFGHLNKLWTLSCCDI